MQRKLVVLVLRHGSMSSDSFHRLAASSWVYLDIPALRPKFFGYPSPFPCLHPFLIARNNGGQLELFIKVCASPKQDKQPRQEISQTWTEKLFKHVKNLQTHDYSQDTHPKQGGSQSWTKRVPKFILKHVKDLQTHEYSREAIVYGPFGSVRAAPRMCPLSHVPAQCF